MAQSSWTYPDEKGIHHSVGLYHGDRSGHFILYCNKRVVAIDFKVQESKTYSFMIDDELCEVFLKKQSDGSFEYDFKINEEIDTPSNTQRKEKTEKDKKKTYAFWGLFVCLILAFTFGMHYREGMKRKKQYFGHASHYFGPHYDAEDLKWKGKPAIATLVFDKASIKTVHYNLKSPTTTFESILDLQPLDGQVWLPNGFPLASGDAFYALYDEKKPQKLHCIQFNRPTGETLLRYFELVIAQEQKMHPDDKPEKILCRIKTILKERDLEGLALLLHRNTPASDNEAFNQDATRKMLGSVFLQNAIEKACHSAGNDGTGG